VSNLVQDAERLRRLQLLTDAALAHLQLDELLAVLLDRTRDLLGVDTCAVLLLDEERNELVARAAVGIEEEVERGVRVPVGKGFAGRVAAAKEPVILPDVDHSDVLNPLLREKGIKSLLGVPLVVGGRVLGVIHVGTLTKSGFDDESVGLLQFVADRAALAIEHARLYEAEQAARTRLERIQAVTDAALANLELEDLLNVLIPRIKEILSADTCAVLLLDRERDELVARAALGIEEEVEQGVRVPVGRGFAGRVAAARAPVVLDDVDSADIWNPILRQKGIKSLLGVPLLRGGEAIGVLHVGSLTPRKFTKDETELLLFVGERVAVAIERAQIHEDLLALDRLKLHFVANASHELRTPSAAVYGALTTIVERRHELSEDMRETLLLMAYEQAARLRGLLDQLLDLSRLDAQAISVKPKPLVLRSTLTQIAADALPEERPLTLDVPEDLAVVADPIVLDRVVTNLLVNAARYGEPPILLTAEQQDRHLRISVEDGGPGVPAVLVPRLFERFERGPDTGGSGLGLAIARAYARAHGGDLVYSPRGRGARFELIVPNG
jgi:signal transduction histidine kinase